MYKTKGRSKYSAKSQALSYKHVKLLIVYFLLTIGLFPGLFGLIGIYNDSKKEFILSKGLYFEKVAHSTALQIEKILDEKIEAIKRLTQLPSLKNILLLPTDEAYRDAHDFWKIVESELAQKDIVFNLYNLDGEMVYSTRYFKTKIPLPKDTWDIKNEALMYISDVIKSDDSKNQFYIEIFAPVKNEFGNNIGVIQAKYIIDQLFSAITHVRIGTTGHANLVNSSGIILICPIFPVKDHKVTDELLHIFSSSHSTGWRTVKDDAHGSRDSIIGYAPIDLQKETLHPESFGKRDWFIFTLQSRAETFAAIEKLKNSFIGYAVTLIALVLLLCSIGMRLIFKAQKDHERDIKHKEKTEAARQFMSNFQQLMLSPLDKLKSWLDKVDNSNNSEELKPHTIRAVKQHLSFLDSITKHLSFYTQTNTIKLESVDLEHLVTTSLSLLDYMFLSHNIKVDLEKSGEPIILEGQSRLLNIVLINILLNAIHATKENGVIGVSLQRNAEWGILRVKDNGCGISDEEMDNIFDPFYSTKKGHKGFGLGLSISRGIIEGHNGKISVVSAKDKGCEVEIKLKLSK